MADMRRSRDLGCRTAHAVALAETRLVRPPHLDGIEIAVARPAERFFPVHMSTTLGICSKVGGAHGVVANGRRLTYPDDAVCVREVGCVWESERGLHGFLSIDIPAELAPSVPALGSMRFATTAAMPSLTRVAHAITKADSALQAEQLVAQLILCAVDAGLLNYQPAMNEARRGVDAARDFLAANVTGRPTLDHAAAAAGLDKFTLLRRFKQTLHTTPHAYLVMLRLARAQARLSAGATPTQAALDSGFADQSHLGRWFLRVYGVTPVQYARPSWGRNFVLDDRAAN